MFITSLLDNNFLHSVNQFLLLLASFPTLLRLVSLITVNLHLIFFVLVLLVFGPRQLELDGVQVAHGLPPLVRAQRHLLVSQQAGVQDALYRHTVHPVPDEDDLLPPVLVLELQTKVPED